jgi:hypothetical protein
MHGGVIMTNWFEVDKEGLKALQAGKPKTFIVNELVQNALDQHITFCDVQISHYDGQIRIEVTDDDPEGFSTLTHAYTLFADTYKRKDPTKRGRFNLGEKQVIAVCNYAEVQTTKGTILFTSSGRFERDQKLKCGSHIVVEFTGEEKEMKELINHAKNLIVPTNIQYTVNEETLRPKPIFKTFEATLDTEILKNERMTTTARKTEVNLYETTDAWIYEMGIPVVKTDCRWSIDVQQKIPLAVDRETIKPAYVQDLYAEVVNNTYDTLTKDDVSELWVRTATKDKDCKKEAVKAVMTKRFGEKFCIGNPFDKASMDEALSRGYNVVFGGEMSAEEWARVHEIEGVQSSTEMFGDSNLEAAKHIEPTPQQKLVGEYAKRIAKRILHIDIKVQFVDNAKASMLACYGNRNLTFNVGRLNNGWFDDPLNPKVLSLLIHELGHEAGWHVEYDYHELLTRLGAELTMLALTEPKFFEVV